MKLRPDAYAVVMATGIVSVAASDHHYRLLSDILLVAAAAVFAVLVVLGVRRWDTRDPDVVIGLFTFVAACAVLASRLHNHPVVLWVLGLTGAAVWLVLLAVAGRAMSAHSWRALRDRAHGGWELASVATSGVAMIAAELSVLTRQRALLVVSAVVWTLGVAIYALMTWLIVWRIGATHMPFAPDNWILMGALAISTLAGTHLHIVLVVVTWLAATAWIPVLLYWTVRAHPPPVQFGWWATVFPLGMYSSASYATAVQTGWRSLMAISLAFCWAALAVWAVAAIGTVVRPTEFAART